MDVPTAWLSPLGSRPRRAFTATCERALAQRGEHLVRGGQRPQGKEGPLLERTPVLEEAFPRDLAALAGPGALHGRGERARVVDRGPLDVMPQVPEVTREERRHRHRLVRRSAG